MAESEPQKTGETQESHANLLILYCRICGRKNVKAPTPYIDKDNGIHFDQNQHYRSFISRLHEVDVQGENPEIFPKRVCQLCVDLFKSGITVLVKNSEGKNQKNIAFFDLVKSLFVSMRTKDLRELQNKFPLADFWAHSSSTFQGCSICQDLGSGVDASASSAYKITTNTNLPANKKVKTLITVTQLGREELGSDYLPDDSGEMYKILEIKTGIISVNAAVKAKEARNGGDEDQEVTVVQGSAKRPASGAAATPDKKRKVDNTPGTNQWPAFNEMLGQNRKYRADKLGEILNLYQFEVPRVLTDLNSSGICFKPNGGKTHFVKNAEFRKALNKCLTLLGKVPTPKKSLLLFRAITDTASDGQLSILSHVGINIDLTNPNLTFLLRRIRNSAGNSSSQKTAASTSKKTTVLDISTKAGERKLQAAKKNMANDVGVANQGLNKLPSGITISKVAAGPSYKPGPKSRRKDLSDRPEVSGFKGKGGEPSLLPNRIRKFARPKINNLINRLNNQWPANRQLRADVLRDVILARPACKQLLLGQGIVFDQNGGNYHLRALNSQRTVHKKQAEKLTDNLGDEEWAEFIAELVFDLLHPEDTLTLRIVGLFVDPLSPNAPLHFRMLFALKKALKMEFGSELSKDLYNEMIASVAEAGDTSIPEQEVSNGLVTLLYCDENEAASIISNATGSPAKRRPKAAAAKPAPKITGPRVPKRTSYADYDSDDDYDPKGSRSTKKIKTESDDDYNPEEEDEDYEEILPKSTRRSSGTPVKYDPSQYVTKYRKRTPTNQTKRGRGRPSSNPIRLSIMKKDSDLPEVSVALKRIDPPASAFPVKKKRGPYKKRQKAVQNSITYEVDVDDPLGDPLGDDPLGGVDETDPFAEASGTLPAPFEIKSESIKEEPAEQEEEEDIAAPEEGVRTAAFEETDNPIEEDPIQNGTDEAARSNPLASNSSEELNENSDQNEAESAENLVSNNTESAENLAPKEADSVENCSPSAADNDDISAKTNTESAENFAQDKSESAENVAKGPEDDSVENSNGQQNINSDDTQDSKDQTSSNDIVHSTETPMESATDSAKDLKDSEESQVDEERHSSGNSEAQVNSTTNSLEDSELNSAQASDNPLNLASALETGTPVAEPMESEGLTAESPFDSAENRPNSAENPLDLVENRQESDSVAHAEAESDNLAAEPSNPLESGNLVEEAENPDDSSENQVADGAISTQNPAADSDSYTGESQSNPLEQSPSDEDSAVNKEKSARNGENYGSASEDGLMNELLDSLNPNQ